VERKLNWLFVASAVAALFGLWNLGEQIAIVAVVDSDAWQFALFERFDLVSRRDVVASVCRGLAFFVPILLVALVVSRGWAELFARVRRRPLDAGWWIAPWIFALLIPPTLPLAYVALGSSFGLVFGCHAFGGTGRYIVNPALLGVVFLTVAYPELFGDDRWLPGAEVQTTWASVTARPADAAATSSAWHHFLGREIGAIGTASSVVCLIGAAVLVALRRAALGTVAGGVVGVLVAGGAAGTLPAYEQLALGQFAFLLAFVATDPSTRPKTSAGEWAFGLFFGLLVVALRMGNPSHPEGSVSALLLACMCVPLFDEVARRGKRAWANFKRAAHG